jgi:hypothetical protein
VKNKKIEGDATRTITHASDSTRPVKEWDKAAGVYTYSVEYQKNFNVISQAIATSMWSPQVPGLNQTVFNAEVWISILSILVVFSLVVTSRNRIRKLTLSYPL